MAMLLADVGGTNARLAIARNGVIDPSSITRYRGDDYESFDRVVKTFLAERSGNAPGGSRHLPQATAAHAPSFTLLFKGARDGTDAEIAANPRARSAKLRAAVRTDAPAWGMAA